MPVGNMRMQEWQPKSIEDRIKLIRKMVYESIRDPAISRQLALAITHGCPWRDSMCELEAINLFMAKNIRYTGDIAGYDTYQSARRTLQFRGGDCDDGFTLIATLAMGNGFGVKGAVTKNEANGPYAHIFPLIAYPKMNPDRWLPIDWTIGFSKSFTLPPHAPRAGLEFDGHQIVYGPRIIQPQTYMGW
jgi:hypothetical protein